ncbi:MAG: AAA family ATPase [Pseudomonadota bacterium]
MLGPKIIVSGTSCTGKTTLGRQLARKLGRVQIDLDDLHFLPDWVAKEKEVFIADVKRATDAHDAWVVSGSYQSVLHETLWPEADTIIWLDLPLHVILSRYFKRTYRRVRYREKCCGENYETLHHVIFVDNMLKHILKSYAPRKARLADWRHGRFANKHWIVPTTAKEVESLLASITSEAECA